jgi:hypothetical protein
MYGFSVVGRNLARITAMDFAPSTYLEAVDSYNHVLSSSGAMKIVFNGPIAYTTVAQLAQGYIEFNTAVGDAKDVGKDVRVYVGGALYQGTVTAVNQTGLSGQTPGTFAVSFEKFGASTNPELTPGPVTTDATKVIQVAEGLVVSGNTVYISSAPTTTTYTHATINEYRYRIVAMGLTSPTSCYVTLDREPPTDMNRIVLGYTIADGRNPGNWYCPDNPVVSVTDNNLFEFRDVFKSGYLYKVYLINEIDNLAGGTELPQTVELMAPQSMVQTNLEDFSSGKGYLQYEFDDNIKSVSLTGITYDDIIIDDNVVTVYTTEFGRRTVKLYDIIDDNGNAVFDVEKTLVIQPDVQSLLVGEYGFTIKTRRVVDIADVVMDKVIEWLSENLM